MKNLVSKIVVMFVMVFVNHFAFAGITPAVSSVEVQTKIETVKTEKVEKLRKSKIKWYHKLVFKAFSKKMVGGISKTLAIILAILLPGLIWLWVGLITDWDKAWWICLLLCFLFFLPGWIYGFIKIIKSS